MKNVTKMRVLMVTPSYYPIKGGTEEVVKNLSIELNKKGIKTDILTFNMNRKWNTRWRLKIEKIDAVTIFKIPGLNWLPISHSDKITFGINLIPGRFRHYLKEYDIIHFHGGDLTLPLFSYTVKKPKIFHSHGLSLDFYKRYFLSRWILKNIADMYIAISKDIMRNFVALGIPPRKVRLLPNAVNTKIYLPSGEKINNLILFVGRITYTKGLHVLLESLHHLKTSIHLVIIGPSDWDAEYFKKMLTQMENENRKGIHRITYLGEQEPRNIVKWYQKASIFVLPSLVEAFAIVNIEALACGTPVIATNVGGIPDIVQHGKNGILIPPSNPIKLAKAIQYLLDNPDIGAKFGIEGRKLVVENFSYTTITTKLYKIYEEILQSKGYK